MSVRQHGVATDKLRNRLLVVAAGASVADVAATAERTASADQVLRRHGVMTLDEATAVVGLWMRWHSRVVMVVPNWGVVNTTRWSTYWYAVRGAVPSAWRYVGACIEAERCGKSRLGELAMSTLVRLHRALRARDEVHWIAWGAHRNDAGEELLYHLDAFFLLMLGAAFDASARSTYLIHDLGTDPRHQSWRTLLSSGRLHKIAPTLVAAAGRNDAIGRRKLIGALRNSIHEEPLHGVSHAGSHSFTITVPEHSVDTVLDAASEAGSPEEFGIRQHARNVDIQPDAFVEAMMHHTIEDIDRQMAATEVGRVAVGKHDPPADDDPNFGALASFSVLALTGLAELGARFEASLRAQG